jgi:hypothetical protein
MSADITGFFAEPPLIAMKDGLTGFINGSPQFCNFKRSQPNHSQTR